MHLSAGVSCRSVACQVTWGGEGYAESGELGVLPRSIF